MMRFFSFLMGSRYSRLIVFLGSYGAHQPNQCSKVRSRPLRPQIQIKW